MKLYEAPLQSYLKIIDNDIIIAPMSYPLNYNIIYFENINGMFSLCKDINNNYIRLAAWTKVKKSNKKEFENQKTTNNLNYLTKKYYDICK